MISNRLKSLVKYINENDNVIDVGCDHALLDIYLIKNNYINKIIVSDISSNALNQGIKNIRKYKLENNIETRLGNGLEVINGNDIIDTILISGMGSFTALNILNNKNIKNIKKIIIQSNNNYDTLRKEVPLLGFKIYKEEVVIDKNQIYINIVFVKGISNLNENEIIFGTNNMINKEIYYRYLLNKFKKIYLKTKNQELKQKINYLEQIINE